MIVGVPTETGANENRVALIPDTVSILQKEEIQVVIQSGAGDKAGFPDRTYQNKGAEIAPSREELYQKAEIILKVNAAGADPASEQDDVPHLHENQTLIAFLDPLSHPNAMQPFAEKKAITFSMELMPRITRAQSMDALSSMATIAGYKAVLIAASTLPQMFPMMMTAAGTIKPAKILVVGAGVAGLQACATAKRLGGVVSAYDVRPAVKEQVESVGAKFVELDLQMEDAETKGGYAKEQSEEFLQKQREEMGKVVAEQDVVITTAAVPGKKAPVIITTDMVRQMKPGSVLVDLAAERGGNCELTKAGETIHEQGVTVIGPMNVPSTVPSDASRMYSKNITTFLLHLIEEGKMSLDRDDEIIKETLITRNGEILNPRVRELLGMATETQEG